MIIMIINQSVGHNYAFLVRSLDVAPLLFSLTSKQTTIATTKQPSNQPPNSIHPHTDSTQKTKKQIKVDWDNNKKGSRMKNWNW